MTNDELRAVADSLTTCTWTEEDAVLKGTAPAAQVDLTPTHVIVTAAVPDEVGEVVLLNVLMAERPDWPVASQWLTHLFIAAQRSHRAEYTAFNYARGVTFKYDRLVKQATLRIMRK